MNINFALLQLPRVLTPEPPGGVNWEVVISGGLRVLIALLLASFAFWALRLLTLRLERSIGEGDPSPATLGLAISFGAQSQVGDVLSGLFILFENQFGVGDVVRIGDAGGLVEKMTLRIVVLRNVHGVGHVIPNGEISRVSNMTRSWSRAVLEIGVAYKENVDRMMEVMRDVGRELWEDEQWQPLLIEEPTVPGIESFGDSAVNIRMGRRSDAPRLGRRQDE